MKKIILSVASVLLIGGAGLALQPSEPTTAEDKPPLVIQVENHEERIGDLEVKTDKTQTQVNQNTADIEAVRQQTGTTAAEPVPTVTTPVAQPAPSTAEQTTAVEPQPAPQPEPDPRTVTAVVDTPGTNPELQNHSCKYTLYSAEETNKQGSVIQSASVPCYQVGDILPRY